MEVHSKVLKIVANRLDSARFSAESQPATSIQIGVDIEKWEVKCGLCGKGNCLVERALAKPIVLTFGTY